MSIRLSWLRKVWFDLLVIAGAAAAAALLIQWRNGQFEGYGLLGTYYEKQEFNGAVIRKVVEPHIDFSDETDARYERSAFSVVWSGTIVIPKAGHYRFAVESDDGSWLDIDGQIVVDNGGVHGQKKRDGVRLLTRGPHRINVRYFQAGQGAMVRVYWQPMGRRGGMEYIPATLLFPTPPHEVNLGRAHAIPPRDLPAMVGLLLCLAAAVLLLGRRALRRWAGRLRRRSRARIDLVLFMVLFAGAMSLRMWDLSAAGQTWDEDVYWSSGRNFVQNVLSLDLRAESWAWNKEHPALAKWIYGPATLVADSYEPARIVAVFLGALTCALLFLVGRDLINRRVGFIGGALCAVMPHLIAHHKIIGLETPTGLLYTVGVWLFLRGVKRQGNTGYYLAAGLCAGLALATRLTNLSLLIVMVALYLITHHREIRAERRFPVSITLGLTPLVIVGTFFLIWPYMWENPLQHVGEMLSHWKPDIYLEYFMGKRREPPIYYFPLYFVITLPVVVIPALILGLARAGTRLRDLGFATLLIWFLAPFVVMFSPMARDGVRYLFPALIAACVLMAAGLDWLGEGLGKLFRSRAAVAPIVAVLAIAAGMYSFRCGLTVHPYYLDFYNVLVGGPKKVARKRNFEIAWWGEGIQEGVDYITRNARQGASVWIYVHPRHVVRLRPDLVSVNRADQADYVIHNNLFNDHIHVPQHRVAHVVRVAGAPMVWVYHRAR